MFKFKKRKIKKQKELENFEINSVEEELYFLNEEIKKTPPGLKHNEYLKRRNEILMGKIPIDEFEHQHNIIEKMQEEKENFEVSSSENIQAVQRDGITKLFEREKTINNDFWKTCLDLDQNSDNKCNFEKLNIEKIKDMKIKNINNDVEEFNEEKAIDIKKENKIDFDYFEQSKDYIDVPVYENKKFDEEQLRKYNFAQEIFKKEYSNSNEDKNNNKIIDDDNYIDVDQYFGGNQQANINQKYNSASDRMWEILKNQSLEKTLEALEKNEKVYDPGYKLYEDEIIKALTELDDPLKD